MANGLLRRCIEKLLAGDGYIKDDGKWIPVKEYKGKYLEKLPCEDAKRCPEANDTYCAGCEVKK
jgi:hypothetical protein